VEWLEAAKRMGPPGDAVHVGDDRYLAPVADGRISVEYLVIPFEYRIIVKRIG
jgi:hypothetical protein